jgi:hypothetical protein
LAFSPGLKSGAASFYQQKGRLLTSRP